MNETALSYLEQLGKNRSDRTVKTYAVALNKFCDIVGDDAPFTSETFVRFLRKIADAPASTQAIYITAVRQLYMFYGVDHAVTMPDLSALSKRYSKKPDRLSLPEFDRTAIELLIEYTNTLTGDILGLRDRAFVLVQVDTGLRISETCSLTRGAIDWAEYRGVIVGKGNKKAIIRYSNRAIDALRDYLRARIDLDAKTGKPANSLPLFARHDHQALKELKPIHVSGIWYAIKQRMQEAAIDPTTIRIHDFRHYFVTRAYAATNDIQLTKELARHESINTTSRYTHLDGKIDEAYHLIFNQEEK